MGFFERLFGKSSSKKGASNSIQSEESAKIEVNEVSEPVKEVAKAEAKAEAVKEEKNINDKVTSTTIEVKATKKTEAKKQTPKKVEIEAPKKEKEEKIESPEAAVEKNETTPISNDSSNENITGHFEINRSKDGKKYFFNLYASNKVGIATSQMYSSAQSALIGIKSVIANAATAPIEDQSLKKYEELPFPKWIIYIDKGGKYRFHLCAANGSNVCHSQGYTTKAACKNGIDSIIRSSRNAEIDKTYLTK